MGLGRCRFLRVTKLTRVPKTRPANAGLSASQEADVKKVLGLILIASGVFGLAWGGFTYTTREKVIDIGPIHATRDETHNVLLPPIAGAAALICGILLL